ncbi:hypothetical protein ABNIH1_07022 [Acinetobacter baumannii ABNIH1]|nr:hypothetical protein ABNIH1_07022 [Acinetobacter baumannii ABNIH1]
MLESSLGGITDTILGIDIHPYKITHLVILTVVLVHYLQALIELRITEQIVLH